MDERFQSVDKTLLARRFGAAARHYDAHARFQQEVGQVLLEWMPSRPVSTDLAVSGLDLGCGTGFFLPQLANRCDELVGLDLAPGMLAQAALRGGRAQLVCGDAERLPFADNTFDWVFSSLTLQWCERPAQAFRELLRVVKPGGQIHFSTLLDESLWQLRAAWQQVDGEAHLNRFLSLTQLVQALAEAGEAAPVLAAHDWEIPYHEAPQLLRDLKGIGANQVNAPRATEHRVGLQGRARLQRFIQAYEQFRQPDGQLVATYRVCLGALCKPC
ncbi:malonyl-ACP O-methyltransferase BioC [Aeromonas cavernicola]|uniref:Malonyl-[acyl-carrier protein] O-methyltransferase n=1 Tax=Aeromonas cavernicola TaxID=1006623 RepID=A0A2H9U1A4_9GAMM|nr:malonyl-ACP O-methyltransferase BioC [Aeromonas cavernicola]PJG57836.1 malonyl-[acyl-carrier protein] O-methyltransferase BioC [Aeromonas cavernicola]